MAKNQTNNSTNRTTNRTTENHEPYPAENRQPHHQHHRQQELQVRRHRAPGGVRYIICNGKRPRAHIECAPTVPTL